MKNFLKLATLSDPNRVKALKRLDWSIPADKASGFNYYPADGKDSPYASTLPSSLLHWLEDDVEVRLLIEKIPCIRREDIYCKEEVCRQS